MNPVEKTNRIQSIDLLRGIAILGILIMNIQSFAMPSAAYNNPLAFGDLIKLNKMTWILSHLFADQKFMSIFSILFGAGIILITEKKELLMAVSQITLYQKPYTAAYWPASCSLNLYGIFCGLCPLFPSVSIQKIISQKTLDYRPSDLIDT